MKSIQNSGFGAGARNGAGAAVFSPRTESGSFLREDVRRPTGPAAEGA